MERHYKQGTIECANSANAIVKMQVETKICATFDKSANSYMYRPSYQSSNMPIWKLKVILDFFHHRSQTVI